MPDLPVTDPFGIERDPAMPFLARALDPLEVRCKLEENLSVHANGSVWLHAIRVVRHKPGRRCLIEYELETERVGKITLMGKVRARGTDIRTYRVQRALWNGGFGTDGASSVSVPEPVGIIPEFHMWLQRKVPGTPATRLLAGPNGSAIAGWISEAAHELHQKGIRPQRSRHTMSDELRILHERLPLVARTKPEWEQRLQKVLAACDRLGASTPKPEYLPIHRDFYPDQVLINGPCLYLLDLDLYCEGDPGLDIGNFIGHLTEHSLRTLGAPDTLKEQEEVLEERFVGLSGAATRAAVRGYAALTLVRHIHLSTQFPKRRMFTESLLELCEERLGAA